MSIFRAIVVISGFLLIALVVYLNHTQNNDFISIDGFCVITQSECVYTEQANNISVVMSPAPIMVETELLVELSNSSSIDSVSNAYIEGVSMYMGKIPVFFKLSENSSWQATTMLGMCSDPDMQWRMVMELNVPGTTEPKIISFKFNSRR